MRGVAAAAVFALSASPAAAQLIPGGGLPALPAAGPLLQRVPETLGSPATGLGGTLGNTLGAVDRIARDAVGRPVNAPAPARDPAGAPIVRDEVLAIAPSAPALAAARALGLELVREDTLSALGISVAVLRAPDGMDAIQALAALRKADPAGGYDYNHLYGPSGDGAPSSGEAGAALPAGHAAAIGMIDAGIDVHHPALRHALIRARDFAGGGQAPATMHGTAVASLLVGDDDDFHGALPGTTLYAADVYGGMGDGGSAEDIARALAWLAQENVPVANASLAGPPNALLAVATQAFLARGHVLVAAVGNDGPAAPLRYPAAYPGVAGVTAVDGGRQIQLDASRGADVAFAARGVDVRAAVAGARYQTVTGTSFAAPAVAARFAILLPRPDIEAVARAWKTLEAQAVDLGAPGRDPVFGYGYLEAPGAGALSAHASRSD